MSSLLSEAGRAINPDYLRPEEDCLPELLRQAEMSADDAAETARVAGELVLAVRRRRPRRGGLDAFLQEYDLASQEGIVLMCLAEALLRIPDSATANRLIADKLAAGDWARHLGVTDSLFVNASTWGLMLTGRLVQPETADVRDPSAFLARLTARLGEPLVRTALRQAMRILGHQFVTGRTIAEALEQAREHPGYRYSFDMLGEAAYSAADAERYFQAYREAIDAVGSALDAGPREAAWAGISVKLSALFPRYEIAQRGRVHAELAPRLLALAGQARDRGIGLTVDAEESERLELLLELVGAVLRDPVMREWEGFGVAVQAYQKRAGAVLRWLQGIAADGKRRINVRLVKGAYWDSEIKRAQERGLTGYPVYTRKANTDVSYLACARFMLAQGERLYPQFATHNAQTIAAVLTLARRYGRAFEFQRLHGMGEDLYAELADRVAPPPPCRVYAPVGSHEDLLPYLVRRLLENGANTSFVNRISDERVPAAAIVADPVRQVRTFATVAHPRIPLPGGIFGAERANSRGVNFADGYQFDPFMRRCAEESRRAWVAYPVVGGEKRSGRELPVCNPARRTEVIGTVIHADAAAVDRALGIGSAAQPTWNDLGGEARADLLRKAADVFEAQLPELVAVCVREAGKTLPDGVAEVREAVDYLRYYAAQAARLFGASQDLPGPAGEDNRLRLRGRGVFACISPWNFPLAIFTGQVAAALAAGNAVIAKPAEQTPIAAARAVALLHEAGVPVEILHLLPGDGADLGSALAADERVAGIAFTGSTETARVIQRGLAARGGAIPTLIAETGGLNAMIVDSSALPEQLVADVVASAFNSAGQRCSALRVLFLQEEIADRVEALLAGCMDELCIGDPAQLATDIGPVIDAESRDRLDSHARTIVAGSRWSHRCALPPQAREGTFVAPLAVEIDGLARLAGEVFGPMLHVVRYESDALERVLDAINATGYGLTLGIQTRIDSVARRIADRVRAGNVYVNRNMIGAAVGMQPFGGCGLSGTGPKAGGPHYLPRFATEQTLTINTAAVGGNASLLSLSAD